MASDIKTQADKNKSRIGINVGGSLGLILGFVFISKPKKDSLSAEFLHPFGSFIFGASFLTLFIGNCVNETSKVTESTFTPKDKNKSRIGLNVGGSVGLILAYYLARTKNDSNGAFGLLILIFSVGALFLGNILNEVTK